MIRSMKETQWEELDMTITKIAPSASGFSAKSGHGQKKQRVLAKLDAFFDRFFGLSSGTRA